MLLLLLLLRVDMLLLLLMGMLLLLLLLLMYTAVGAAEHIVLELTSLEPVFNQLTQELNRSHVLMQEFLRRTITPNCS